MPLQETEYPELISELYKVLRMNIVVRYINKDGFISNYIAQVKHGLNDPTIIKSAYENIITQYNENVLLIRGYVEDVLDLKKSASKLQTDKFSFDIKKKKLSYYELREPAFGSIDECIKRNLSIEFQELIGKYSPFGGGVNINLIGLNNADDVYYMALTEVRDIGLYTYVYKLNFTFLPDWSSTCDSCINGMAHVKNELQRISNQLFVNESSPVVTTGNIISDLVVSDSSLLKDQINILLANAIKISKIADFTITDVTDEFKGLNYG